MGFEVNARRDAQLWFIIKVSKQPFKIIRVETQVCIEFYDAAELFAANQFISAVKGADFSGASGAAGDSLRRDGADEIVSFRIFLHDLDGAIARAVIDDDPPQRAMGLCDHRSQSALDMPDFILRGGHHDIAQQRFPAACVGQRGSAGGIVESVQSD